MMQHVYKHHDVNPAIFHRYAEPVEFHDRNGGVFTHKHVNSFDFQIGPQLTKPRGQSAVAGSNVEHCRVWRKEVREMSGEYLDTPAKDKILMCQADQVH